jgi:hypothetical protein
MSKPQPDSRHTGAAAAIAAIFGYLDQEGFLSWWRPTARTSLDALRGHGFDALDQLELAGELSCALGRPVPEWREGAETIGDFAARISPG